MTTSPYLVAGFTPSDLTDVQAQVRYDLASSIFALIRNNENVPIIEAITILNTVALMAWDEVRDRVAAAQAAAGAPVPPAPAPTGVPLPAPPAASTN